MSQLSPGLFLLLLLCFSNLSHARRRGSKAEKAFEESGGIDWKEESEEKKKESKQGVLSLEVEGTTTTSTSTKTVITQPVSEETPRNDDVISKLLAATKDVMNLTRVAENRLEDEEVTNKTIFWIDASYKAMNFNLSVSEYKECAAWRKFWNISTTTEPETANQTETSEEEENSEEEHEKNRKETEIVKEKERLEELGLSEDLLDTYRAVGIVFKEICGDHGRELWFSSTEDAKMLGITESSPICEPFKEELNPDALTLAKLAHKLNDLIENITQGIEPSFKNDRGYLPVITADRGLDFEDENAFEISENSSNGKNKAKNSKETQVLETKRKEGEPVVHLVEELSPETETIQTSTATRETTEDSETETKPRLQKESVEKIEENDEKQPTLSKSVERNEVVNYDDDIYDYEDLARRFRVHSSHVRKRGVVLRIRRSAEADQSETEDEDDWIESIHNEADVANGVSIVDEALENVTQSLYHWIEINATDPINPTLLIGSMDAIDALGINVTAAAFLRYEKVGLYLPGICADYVPKAIDAFNSSSFEGVDIEGPIGVNISALEAAGVNLTALAEKLRNDTEVDDILSRTEGSVKTLGGSFILPVLNKNQYDPFSAPIVFQGSAVVVRFGIYIESMSNFQTTTMDYDMDIYLMMSWRDARLVNPYDKPILVKEEEILEKIWRPDPFFANAKEAEFHEVTFLNFLMRIYPDGLVLYETRVKITPSCNLILCKYPHDKQTCDLLIKSFAYPIETVRFEWFSRRKDAIDKNPDVKLPELYIDRYEPTVCNKTRKSGEFSCLRAVFRLKRDVGFHIAQTYIPTSLALMFSWVGVWLPEEFMEGRIGVAITVLLTLSTESAGAREHLPSVSYLKAIDLWFGFITGFVFFTLLQTLFVIGFDKRSNQMRKWALKKKSDVTEELRNGMLEKAKRYHKTGRYLDNFCRVFYPLSFLLFLIMYYFVFTEGRQDDCINRR